MSRNSAPRTEDEAIHLKIYIPGVGQHDNIGDIILRRQLLDWLRPFGELHVYVGASPDGYDDALGLRAGDSVYRSFSKWYRSALWASVHKGTSYFFKPGEIQLTLIGMKEHLVMLPVIAAIRARGGAVARVGSGARNFAPLPRLLMAPSISLCSFIAWRDRDTTAYLGSGHTMPDLAFGEGSAEPRTSTKRYLVVSMRGDRQYPSAEWMRATQAFASSRDLSIVVVTQVLRDSERGKAIAKDLNAEFVGWDGTNHLAQEDVLRGIYTQTHSAVSDRLHVLVTAFTEGAMPIAALVDSSKKIARHFEAAGITGIDLDTNGKSEDEIVAFFTEIEGRSTELRESLQAARLRLAGERDHVEDLLLLGSPSRRAGNS